MFHFISNDVTKNDKDLFFGPINDNDVFVKIESHWVMAHLLHHIGLFKSISQARKNGWNHEIPKGFNFWTVGRKAKKQTFFVLNIK